MIANELTKNKIDVFDFPIKTIVDAFRIIFEIMKRLIKIVLMYI